MKRMLHVSFGSVTVLNIDTSNDTKKLGTVATKTKRDTPLRMGRPYGALTVAAGLRSAATPGVSSFRLRRRSRGSIHRTASVQHSRHVAATALGNARKGNNEVGDGKWRCRLNLSNLRSRHFYFMDFNFLVANTRVPASLTLRVSGRPRTDHRFIFPVNTSERM